MALRSPVKKGKEKEMKKNENFGLHLKTKGRLEFKTDEKDLGDKLNEDLWQEVMANVGGATREGRYFTPLKLFKMSLTPDDKCVKCNDEFLHVLWERPEVLSF